MRASARDLLLQQGYSSPNQGPSIDAFEASLRMGGTSSYISSTEEEEEGMEYRNGSGNGRSVWSMEWGEGPLCQSQCWACNAQAQNPPPPPLAPSLTLFVSLQ
ncbi:hypothetical protein BHE74_00054668, partial [Ensete ventricosum]